MATNRKRTARKSLREKIQRPERWIVDYFCKGYTPEKLHYRLDVWRIEFNHENRAVDIWKEHGNWVVQNYIRKYPGKRPFYWWEIDAPRWGRKFGSYYDGTLPEPRRRIGGIGTPSYDVLNISPWFSFGIPRSFVIKFQEDYYNGRSKCKDPWLQRQYEAEGRKEGDFKGVALDMDNPPTYESQAAYLKRHNLLTKSEERRLKPADFEPESV